MPKWREHTGSPNEAMAHRARDYNRQDVMSQNAEVVKRNDEMVAWLDALRNEVEGLQAQKQNRLAEVLWTVA